MFCDEPIQKVWHLNPYMTDDSKWEYPLYHFQMKYYVTNGYWFVFQTEHYWISIGADGVCMYNSIEEIMKPDLELSNDDSYQIKDYLSEESLIFKDERILSVTDTVSGWNLEFDHFNLQLIPYKGKQPGWSSYYNFIPYLGVSQKLKNCKCGGEAELLVDQVNDYYIHCKRCRCSTCADYRLNRVVKDWNTRKTPCSNDKTPFENFFEHQDHKISRIMIPEHTNECDTDHFFCENLIIQFDDIAFKLEQLCIPEDKCIFNIVHKICSLNPKMWPYEIALSEDEKMLFQYHIQEGNYDKMVFSSHRQIITVTAGKTHLEVTIDDLS